MRRNKLFFFGIAVTGLLVLMYLVVIYSKEEELPDKPIRPTITLQKKKIEYIGGESCWFGSESFGVCSSPIPSHDFNRSIKEEAAVAYAGGTIRIKFPIKPDEFYLSVTNEYGDRESIGKPDLYSYKLPSKAGYYRYNLTGIWEEKNSAAYYFGVHIKE